MKPGYLRLLLSFGFIYLLEGLLLLQAFEPLPLKAQAKLSQPVLTRSYNNSRTGANLQETVLNTSNVNDANFGKLFSRRVAGHIYAQPLYVPTLTLPGKGVHDVVFVATQHNEVYAFDATNPAQSAPLWRRNLGPSAPIPDPEFGSAYGDYKDIQVEVGITSTPVIDLTSNTLYVVAFVRPVAHQFQHLLYALDITTGLPKLGSPVKIEAVYPGKGAASVNNVIRFEARRELQRAGLLLVKGIVYIAFASYADTQPYHGWVLGYAASSLRQVSVFNTTPNGDDGGIWMSGQGISADEKGDLYLVVGNGSFDAKQPADSGKNYGNAILRLRPPTGNGGGLPGRMSVVSWFVPYNQAHLSRRDLDLGSTGALLVPGTNLLLAGSKAGTFYLVDRDRMGGYRPDADTQIVQSFQASNNQHIHGSPVYWNIPTVGPSVYIWSESDRLKAFQFVEGRIKVTPIATSLDYVPQGMPGGILSLSANGSTPGTGLIWASHPTSGNANQEVRPGVLRAYDASNVGVELWNSEHQPERDRLGGLAKFNPAVVANGRVYMATFSGELIVYGLNPPSPGGRFNQGQR